MTTKADGQPPLQSGREKVDALLALIISATKDATAEYEATGQGIPSPDSQCAHPLDPAPDALALKKAIRVLEGACEQLCTTLAQPIHTLANRSIPFESSCLRIVIEFKVADVLDGFPDGLHVSEIAKKVNIEKGKLARILRLLATRNCFREVTKDVFANNRLSMSLLSSNAISAAGFGLAVNECSRGVHFLYETFINPAYGPSYDSKKSSFMYSVKDEINDGNLFDWLDLHPEKRERFGRGMIWSGVLTGSLAAVKNFPWEELPPGSTFCDVGSGIGAFSIVLARAHPHLKITLQDLSGPMEQGQAVWAQDYPEAIQEGRVEFVTIDFFKEIPVKGQDVYYMRYIIHDWPDSEAVVILRNIHQAMHPQSRLFIQEYVLQHLNEKNANQQTGVEKAPAPLLPNYGSGNVRLYNMDINMLGLFNSKERTLEEFIALGSESGLHLEKVWDFAETCMLEFRKLDFNA